VKDTVYLVISRGKVERMTKGLPQLQRGEIPLKLVVEVKDTAFGTPTIERHVVVESAFDGLALNDLTLSQSVITEAEAELLRGRRLDAMAEILGDHGYTIIAPPEDGDDDSSR
jgi:hypothetical protein